MRALLSSLFFGSCLTLSLSGCLDPISNMAVGAASVSTYSVTGKGPVDLALSDIKGQDCDIRNPKKYDGHYCIDEADKTLPPSGDQVYCHRTLADPECTALPDPHRNRNRPIVDDAGAKLTTSAKPSLPASSSKPKAAAQPAQQAKDPVPLLPAKKQGSEHLKGS